MGIAVVACKLQLLVQVPQRRNFKLQLRDITAEPILPEALIEMIVERAVNIAKQGDSSELAFGWGDLCRVILHSYISQLLKINGQLLAQESHSLIEVFGNDDAVNTFVEVFLPLANLAIVAVEIRPVTYKVIPTKVKRLHILESDWLSICSAFIEVKSL